MNSIIFNFVVTKDNNPLFFEQLAEDGWGKYMEGCWEDISYRSDFPLNISDYTLNKHSNDFNVIYKCESQKDETIDKSTLKILKVELNFLT